MLNQNLPSESDSQETMAEVFTNTGDNLGVIETTVDEIEPGSILHISGQFEGSYRVTECHEAERGYQVWVDAV